MGFPLDRLSDWAFPTTLVGDAIKFRPLILDSLYRRDVNPWSQLESTLAKVCMRNKIDVDAFLKEIGSIPVPEPDSDWESLPCFYLIDFLTRQHRDILQLDLPAIHYRMKTDCVGESAFRMRQSLYEFRQRLQSHIAAEEDEIFPRILRNEYAVLHPDWNEAVDAGNRAAGAAARLLGKEEELGFTLDSWIRQASDGMDGKGSANSLSAVAILLTELERNIKTHSRLEADHLYPMALRLEEISLGAPSAT